jgi:hypothetical protein
MVKESENDWNAKSTDAYYSTLVANNAITMTILAGEFLYSI